jgi:FMN phosphatase YigB (HAD superfamily)
MRYVVGVCLFLSLSSCLSASIVEISSMSKVASYVDAHSLVIFDIDNTLIEPQQTRATDQWFSAMVAHAQGLGYDTCQAVAQVFPYYERAHAHTTVRFVEKKIPAVLKNIVHNAQAVMALSSRSLPMIIHTQRQFKELGINLTASSLGTKEITFTLPLGPVCCTQGVAYCGNNDKGKVLQHLLHRWSLKPHKIVFIDDKEKNLQCVERATKKLGIPFIGLRYAACDAKVKSFVLDDASRALLGAKNSHHTDKKKNVLQNLTPKLITS